MFFELLVCLMFILLLLLLTLQLRECVVKYYALILLLFFHVILSLFQVREAEQRPDERKVHLIIHPVHGEGFT